MKKIYYIILLEIFISMVFVNAQMNAYFSLKNTKRGIMIGVEIYNLRTKRVINPKSYVYKWVVPRFSTVEQETFTNFISLPIFKTEPISVELTLKKLFSKEVFNFKTIIK